MYSIEIDPRSRGFASARPESLSGAASSWPTTGMTPKHVGEQLRVAREMFVHAAFLYDLFTVAAAWCLLALEPALRDRLSAGRNVKFRDLIVRAQDAGHLTNEEAARLRAGLKLRHVFAHPERWSVYSPGMSEMLLKATHDVVARLFPDDSEGHN